MSLTQPLGGIPERVRALRARHNRRDITNAQVQEIRRGNFEAIAPDLFSDTFKKPIVANMIDAAARDSAAVLAPLPAFNCSSSSMLSDAAKRFADKRTKIANHYPQRSRLGVQMFTGADQYNTYGLLVLCVRPDFEEKFPYITVESPVGAYPVWNDRGEVVEFARVFMQDWFTLCANYPHLKYLESKFYNLNQNSVVQVVKYSSGSEIVSYLPDYGNAILEQSGNPLGKCYYVAAQRPGVDDEIRGAFDDVIWVQLARHRLEMLKLDGIEQAVHAPIAVGDDVLDLPTGPGAIIRTRSGAQSIGRVNLQIPAQAFSAGEQLKEEIRLGAMSPEARSGNIDASVVTGRGVQQLMAGFSSQIAVGQAVLGDAYERAIRMCFEFDEKLWPNTEKEIRGFDGGSPYSIRYRPGRDIAGDHTVSATYGFAAGLDPNRALVFLLQADGAGIISKDYLRRNLPVDINAADEESKINVELSRRSLIESLSALSQSIPQLTAAGGDPLQVIQQMAKFIELLEKGQSVEKAAIAALTPPAPPPGQQAPPGPGEPQAGAPGGPAGFQQNGLPTGLAPGQATEGPGGRPDLNMLLAGLARNGAPQLQAAVSRQSPTG